MVGKVVNFKLGRETIFVAGLPSSLAGIVLVGSFLGVCARDKIIIHNHSSIL